MAENHTLKDGPALPHESRGDRHPWMSLRDYFAAQALVAVVSHDAKLGRFDITTVGEDCYRIADAMLKARDAR